MPDSSARSAAIVLAAGASTRMGTPKQLLDFHGRPLVRHAAELALSAGCDPVIVVLGAHQQEVRQALDGLAVETTVNEQWPQGMGASIQTGLSVLENREISGATLMLADQPFVTAAFLSSLAGQHRQTGKPIVSARYSGTAGVPVFFAREAFPYLMALKPNQGCKGIILGRPADALLIDCPEAAIDIDTPEDYQSATRG